MTKEQKIINFFGRHKGKSKIALFCFNLLVKYRKHRFDTWLRKEE